METVFQEQLHGTWAPQWINGVLRLWWKTIVGIFRTAPGEHLSMFRQDAGFALRMMRKSPGFTIAARLLQQLLFEVTATDPLTYVGVAAVLGLCAFVACYGAPSLPRGPHRRPARGIT